MKQKGIYFCEADSRKQWISVSKTVSKAQKILSGLGKENGEGANMGGCVQVGSESQSHHCSGVHQGQDLAGPG